MQNFPEFPSQKIKNTMPRPEAAATIQKPRKTKGKLGVL